MIGGKLIKDYNEVSLDTLIDLDTQRPNNDPVTGCKLGDYH